jgi:hypothetical protein
MLGAVSRRSNAPAAAEPAVEATTAGQGIVGRLRAVLAYRDTRTLVFLFLITQLLDAVTTAYALRTDRFVEGNPWLDESVTTHPLLTYFTKMAVAGVVVLVLLLLRLRWRMRLFVLSMFTLLALIAPVTNMLRVTGRL